MRLSTKRNKAHLHSGRIATKILKRTRYTDRQAKNKPVRKKKSTLLRGRPGGGRGQTHTHPVMNHMSPAQGKNERQVPRLPEKAAAVA
ncbi:hypothetical protein E2C01_043033 [Portunus trituberculatus]|uniref:Uncharacterized protein n=1 Tax=Portunus trituberculatus TaxID=210409 RepID=A0A5B7FUL1_PORTR|nr:hypothetical protein [Portunus trituberculatus]